jgi:hypothetical protein
MSDYVYMEVADVHITREQLLAGLTRMKTSLDGTVPHNLLSHLRFNLSYVAAASRLEAFFGSIAVDASKLPYAVATIRAVLGWTTEHGWRTTLLLEGHRGKKPLPPEKKIVATLEEALSMREKGPYVIRVQLHERAA